MWNGVAAAASAACLEALALVFIEAFEGVSEITLELCCSAMGVAQGMCDMGKCLVGMDVRRLQKFWGVIFSCTRSPCAVQVWSCTHPCALSSTFIQEGYVGRALLFSGNIHVLLWLYPKVSTQKSSSIPSEPAAYGLAGLKPHQKNIVFFVPVRSGPLPH